MVSRQHKRYAKEVMSKNLTYNDWIREQEEKSSIGDAIEVEKKKSLTNDFALCGFGRKNDENDGNHSKYDESCHVLEVIGKSGQIREKKTYLSVTADAFEKNADVLSQQAAFDAILISMYEGEISDRAYRLIVQRFAKDRDVALIYGDEDIKKDDFREEPWFKPDWSPDRFLSCFYLGGLVAVRAEALWDAYKACKESGMLEGAWKQTGELVYLLLYQLLKTRGGFDKREERTNPVVFHIREVLFHSAENGYGQVKDLKLPAFAEKEETFFSGEQKREDRDEIILSIIIPSKDNVAVLFQCLDSLMERTCCAYLCELILVDNGSSEENKAAISEKVSRINRDLTTGEKQFRLAGCRYLYQPMTFNFSHMCNLGAGKAKGSFFLFLNDDMEILQPDWLDKMLEKARLPRAGAVGVKLLYPGSDTIQHAGITNLRVGPAHKLQFLKDGTTHYFGMNRGVHNMMAATGACLMMSREVFEEAEGFCEELAVAFNDVDLYR